MADKKMLTKDGGNQSTAMPTMPPEVWTIVPSELGYLDLKKCLRVNKLFKSIISTKSQFAEKMFKGKVLAADAIIDTDGLVLNPVFACVHTESSTDMNNVYFFLPEHGGDDMRDCKLTDTSAAKDLATRPGLQEISVQVKNFKAVTVKNKRGVTVLQVMKALCKIFGTKVRGYRPRPIDELYGVTGIQRDLMGDHTGWTGFDYVRTTSAGKLLLNASWFDS